MLHDDYICLSGMDKFDFVEGCKSSHNDQGVRDQHQLIKNFLYNILKKVCPKQTFRLQVSSKAEPEHPRARVDRFLPFRFCKIGLRNTLFICCQKSCRLFCCNLLSDFDLLKYFLNGSSHQAQKDQMLSSKKLYHFRKMQNGHQNLIYPLFLTAAFPIHFRWPF